MLCSKCTDCDSCINEKYINVIGTEFGGYRDFSSCTGIINLPTCNSVMSAIRSLYSEKSNSYDSNRKCHIISKVYSDKVTMLTLIDMS